MANYCIMTIIMEIQKDSEYIEGAKPRLDIEIQKEIPKGENKMNYRMVTVNNHHMKLTEEQFKLFQLLFSEELLVQPAIVEVYNENDFRTVDEIIKNGGNEE